MSSVCQIRLLSAIPICLLVHYTARLFDPHVQYAFAHFAFTFFSIVIAWQSSRLLINYFFHQKVSRYDDKLVLISGCDSGFGLSLALQLHCKGFHVIAGCLNRQSDGAQQLARLACNRFQVNLEVVELDVTNKSSIQSMADRINQLANQQHKKLWAIVHNAGIGHYTTTYWNQNEIDQVMFSSVNVNVFSMIRINNALLPLLTQSPNSRIVLMGSYAGRFTFSTMSSYCISKHSVRVLANSMRRELNAFNIKVVHVEPSMYNTGITNQKVCLANLNHHWKHTDLSVFSPEVRVLQTEEFERIQGQVQAFMNTTCSDIQQVLDTIENAITLKEPLPFYRVSTIAGKLVMYALEWLPEELHDWLLDGQLYSKLIKLLQVRKQST